MTIQYASDLHLEFPANKDFMEKNPIAPSADILVLAGDIMPIHHIGQHGAFWDYLSAHFKTVFWIPGNHEYYGAKSLRFGRSRHDAVRHNVFLVNNIVQVIEGTRFLFTTLWTKISTAHQFEIQNRLSDFSAIHSEGRPFSVAQYNELHEDSVAFLHEALALPFEGPTVVVTHHVPTFLNYPPQYKGDALNEAFAVELFDLIVEYKPDCWIYGHHHCNVGDFYIEKTKLLTNQLGYVAHGKHHRFSNHQTVNLLA